MRCTPFEVGRVEADGRLSAPISLQLHRPALGSDRSHGPTLAVCDLVTVDPGDHVVANRKGLPDTQLGRAAVPLGVEQAARPGVQIRHVAAATGDHHRVLASEVAPVPIQSDRVECLGQGVGDSQSLARTQQVQRVRAPAAMGELDQPTVLGLALAADLGQCGPGSISRVRWA